MYKMPLLLLLPLFFLGLACDARLPLSPLQTDDSPAATETVALTGADTPHGWDDKLTAFRRQASRMSREIMGKQNLSLLFGRGRNSVSGNGTFVGEGAGSSTLQGVGVVTGEVKGMVMIQGTTDINIDGLKYSGQKKGFEVYKGYGFFTATSDAGQKIEVVVVGDGWVVGAGTGIVFWSGDQGWVFWYR